MVFLYCQRLVKLEEIEIIKDHPDIERPMEEVVVEPVVSEHLLEQVRALLEGDDVHDLVEQPNALRSRHPVVQLHQDPNRLEQQHVVKLRGH